MGHLPLSHPKDGGQLYLANMGIPKNVYKEVILFAFWAFEHFFFIFKTFQVGIKFASPFGAKFVIALHQPKSIM